VPSSTRPRKLLQSFSVAPRLLLVSTGSSQLRRRRREHSSRTSSQHTKLELRLERTVRFSGIHRNITSLTNQLQQRPCGLG
jgi:hypothetical protein